MLIIHGPKSTKKTRGFDTTKPLISVQRNSSSHVPSFVSPIQPPFSSQFPFPQQSSQTPPTPVYNNNNYGGGRNLPSYLGLNGLVMHPMGSVPMVNTPPNGPFPLSVPSSVTSVPNYNQFPNNNTYMFIPTQVPKSDSNPNDYTHSLYDKQPQAFFDSGFFEREKEKEKEKEKERRELVNMIPHPAAYELCYAFHGHEGSCQAGDACQWRHYDYGNSIDKPTKWLENPFFSEHERNALRGGPRRSSRGSSPRGVGRGRSVNFRGRNISSPRESVQSQSSDGVRNGMKEREKQPLVIKDASTGQPVVVMSTVLERSLRKMKELKEKRSHALPIVRPKDDDDDDDPNTKQQQANVKTVGSDEQKEVFESTTTTTTTATEMEVNVENLKTSSSQTQSECHDENESVILSKNDFEFLLSLVLNDERNAQNERLKSIVEKCSRPH